MQGQRIECWVVSRRLEKGENRGVWIVVGKYRRMVSAQNHCRRMSKYGHAMRMEPTLAPSF